MKKETIKKISKQAKVNFLSKLQTGKFELTQAYTPAPKLTFDLIPESGLYKCKQDGREMSRDEIAALPGYQISIELIRSFKEPATGFELFPFSREQYLDSLLKSPDDKYLTMQEANKMLDDLDAGNFDKIKI